MKRLTISLALVLGCSSLVHAQSEEYDKIEAAFTDTTGELRLKRVIEQEFSRIAKTNTQGIIGNYVGISTKDNNLSAAYNFVFNRSTIEINTNASLTDGISNLFKNDQINTGVGIGTKFNWMFGYKDINLNFSSDIKPIQVELEKLENDYDKFLLNYDTKLKSLKKDTLKQFKELKKVKTRIKFLRTKKNQLLAGGGDNILHHDKDSIYKLHLSILSEKDSLYKYLIVNKDSIVNDGIDTLIDRFAKTPHKTIVKALQFKADTLSQYNLPFAWQDSLRKIKQRIGALKSKVKANLFSEVKITEAQHDLLVAEQNLRSSKKLFSRHKSWASIYMNNKYDADRKKVLDKFNKVRARDIGLQWVSIGGNVKSESYSIYDPILATPKIAKEKDLIFSLNGSYSYFLNTTLKDGKFTNDRRIHFFTIGGKLNFGNNVGTLKKVNIVSYDTLSSNSFIRSSENAFQGSFDDEFITAELYSDYYVFKGNKDNRGLHLRATVNIGNSKPITSIRGGIIFAALKRDDFTSIVNFELFYGLNDIFKEGEEDSILGRNVFGIQTSFPFNFKL